jgi:hypothetical protein
VDEENGPALALYRRRGFAPEGRIVDAICLDGRWHAHLFMAKPLRDLTELLGHNARGLRFASACHFSREVVSPRLAVIDDRAVDRIRLAKLLVDER